MSKKKLYNQKRTVDFEITTVVSVDIDSLNLRLTNSDPQIIETKVEKAWSDLLKAPLEETIDEDAYFAAVTSISPSIVRCKQIPNSLRVTSIESLDAEDGGKEDDS